MRNQPPEFANVVLDSLTAHIAVLDQHGVIIGVNEPWRRFSALNCGETKNFYVGQSYLAVCEQAVRCGGDPTAAALIAGLRSVLDGTCERFSIEYPCHSPDEQRWFIAWLTPCKQGGESRVVVAHEDITARKKAEIALEKAERTLEIANRELKESLRREQLAARTDELTGLFNRRHFFGLGEQLFKLSKRYGSPLSVVMLDLDHFKQINDNHGHQAGDLALRRVAGEALRHVRSADVLARYGGEEFILLLPETTSAQAWSVAESVRETIASQVVAFGKEAIRLTLSAGIADVMDTDHRLEDAIRRADLALYQAKSAGRNCCRLSAAPLEGRALKGLGSYEDRR